jgi:hypothetical protein
MGQEAATGLEVVPAVTVAASIQVMELALPLFPGQVHGVARKQDIRIPGWMSSATRGGSLVLLHGYSDRR